MSSTASGQMPIDLSDFPSLSGPRLPTSNNSGAAWGTNAETLRLTSMQNVAHLPSTSNQLNQQPTAQPHLMGFDPSVHSNIPMTSQRIRSTDGRPVNDDFPPLGDQHGRLPATALNSSEIVTSVDRDRSEMERSMREVGNSQSERAATTQPQNASANATGPKSLSSRRWCEMSELERWTFPGLEAAFEARRSLDVGAALDDSLPSGLTNAILFGHDLHTLGLDFDSIDVMYNTFAPFPSQSGSMSQFDYHDRHVVPDFNLPSAYTVPNVPPLNSRLNAFSEGKKPFLSPEEHVTAFVTNPSCLETLFAVFYQHPRDVLQESSAIELTQRGWRWHKVLRQWLQKESRETNSGSSLPIMDLAASAPVGVSPMRLGDRTERGIYIFFDPINWRRERREFVLDYGQLDHRYPSQTTAAATANPSAVTTLPSLLGQSTSSTTIVSARPVVSAQSSIANGII